MGWSNNSLVMSLEEKLNYIRNNPYRQYNTLAKELNISSQEAKRLKQTVKNLKEMARFVKINYGVNFGHKNQPYYTEQEMLQGYKPPSYEELLKEF